MLTILIFSTYLAALAVASWPLLALRRFRPVLQLVSGSGCIAAGSTLIGLLAAGFIALPGEEFSRAAAHENTADSSAAEPASNSQPSGSTESSTAVAVPAADATPAVSVAPAAPVEPEIKLDSPDTAPAAKAEDIKIETLADGTIVIPAGRPEWVQQRRSDLTGLTHKIYVTSEPYKLSQDAQRGLDEALKRATNEYISDQLHSPLAAQFIRYDTQAIRDRFVKQTYRETLTFPDPIGPMQQLHAQLEFDQGFRDEISHTWAGRIAESRLYQVGLGAGAALLLLGSVFSYFRLDNATRGYYTGRLQFLTAAAILAIVALGAAAAFQFTWL